MKTQIPITEYIREVMLANKLAVLATESNGRPHASLVAVTPSEDYKKLIFATYRNTRKYTNLINNGEVAMLFENRSLQSLNQPEITVLTAFGKALEVDRTNSDTDLQAHLLRHPELETFLHSSECAIFLVHIDAYQAVLGIDDVNWWTTDQLDAFG